MPRLNYPRITKGDAIAALLKRYSKELQFMKEWAAIRKPYVNILARFAKDALKFFEHGNITPAEYHQDLIDYYKKEDKKDPFPADKFGYLSELQPYFENLNKLANKWKLKASWSVSTLFMLDLINLLKHNGLPDEIDIPIKDLGLIYPWEAPLPPLEIKVPAWAIILRGRQDVQTEINKKLQEYESQIKAKGLHEYPSALDKHARWWFEHHVNHKTYDEIAQLEIHTPGGSLISYARSVGAAVRNFARLIGIKAANIK